MKIYYRHFALFLGLCFILPFGKITALETQELAREKLLTLLSGEWVSRSLYAATKLEIANYLQNEPKSIDELATLTNTHSDSLYRLLRLLTRFGVFEEIAPKVFGNSETSRLLIKGNTETLHSLSQFYGEEVHLLWADFLTSLQTGIPSFQITYKQPVFSYFKENPERAALFQSAMKEKTQAVITSTLTNYDFTPYSTICDLGGGYGQFALALIEKYPHLSATLFELPEVIQKVRNQKTLIPRLHHTEGDFFTSIPPGMDAYLLKSIFHDWDDEKSSLILKKCHAAMHPNSRLLIIDVVLDQSPFGHCMDILMMAITGGKERTLNDFKTLLENNNFKIEKIIPTTTEFSIIEATKT